MYKQWVLADNSPTLTKSIKSDGEIMPTENDFELVEDSTCDLAKGEILCRALFLSVDPITRLYMSYGMEPGDPLPGRQVARVVESRHKGFPKGKLVYGSMGWQTYSVVHPDCIQEMCGQNVHLVEDLPKQLDCAVGSSGSLQLPKSGCLGVLGVPGLTAYIALTKVAKAQPGETLVVSSAAGQIGHLVGQIGKLLGLHVIGYTGDAEKASWIKMELGFDWAFNYRTQDVRQTLKIAAPRGVDIFVDAVGGLFHNTVLNHMNFCGRVVQLGNLALYNCPRSIPTVPANDMAVALKELSIYGFNVYRHMDEFESSLDKLSEWCRSGQLQPFEHVVEGFENMPKAFIDQLQGKSQGKVIVRV